MTQKEKQLLVKDLCARLPYGVKGIHREQVHIITNMDGSGLYPSIQVDGYDAWFPIETFKPYLRPMSSMTEEESKEYNEFSMELPFIFSGLNNDIPNIYVIDWLNEHHFDYRGLIEKSLAIVAPEGMYES